uniref:Uncharacterized protein n=1 Tax=Xiphophorus maculatus TaxID=8083 RepID=A0A3B5QX33_XIPMA
PRPGPGPLHLLPAPLHSAFPPLLLPDLLPRPATPASPGESMFVLTVTFVAVLGPSGWILSNLDHYKGRE